jgi:hypothetical protein
MSHPCPAQVVRALAACGASLDATDGKGNRALHVACERGHPEAAEALLGLGAADTSRPGRQKRAKCPTSKAPISAGFHSFRLIFGRAIISRSGLDAWALFPERARAEQSR